MYMTAPGLSTVSAYDAAWFLQGGNIKICLSFARIAKNIPSFHILLNCGLVLNIAST